MLKRKQTETTRLARITSLPKGIERLMLFDWYFKSLPD
jgi:hypothetical protein